MAETLNWHIPGPSLCFWHELQQQLSLYQPAGRAWASELPGEDWCQSAKKGMVRVLTTGGDEGQEFQVLQDAALTHKD